MTTVNLQYGAMQDCLPDEEYLFQGGDSAMKEIYKGEQYLVSAIFWRSCFGVGKKLMIPRNFFRKGEQSGVSLQI